MNEKYGSVYSIAENNNCVAGCTVSKTVLSNQNIYITYFSLAEGTGISAEYYLHSSFFIVNKGNLTVEYFNKENNTLKKIVECSKGMCIISPVDSFYGIKAKKNCVYTEIGLKKECIMNNVVKGKDVFALKDLISYQNGKIVNMDIVNEEKTVFEVMAFDAGCGLPEHAAPGEAMIFALDGKGIISYEGKDFFIEAGQNFVFEKGGRHAVKAVTKFKMALLLTK